MRLPLCLLFVVSLLTGCTPQPGADMDDRYLVARVYTSTAVEAYRVAYDEAMERGWGVRRHDGARYTGREFLALAPGDGSTLDALVSVSVAEVDDGARVLVRSQIDAPPDPREIPAFLNALAARLGPPLD